MISRIYTKTYCLFTGCLLMLFLPTATNTLAQAQSTIQVIEQQSAEPLSFATFNYAEQKGMANEKGQIELILNDTSLLVIHHVAYGTLSFSSSEMKKAAQSGQLFVAAKRAVTLMPVTVVGIHSGSRQKETLGLGYHQQLSHDAGAFLQLNPSVSGIRKSGSYGFDPVVRGFKYDQLNLVIDGVQCATAACPNRMDPPASQISLNMMEHVELFKGPYALRFGNGFGGTINFVSQKTLYTDSPDVTGRLTSGFEHNGSIFRNEAFVGLSNKKAHLGLFGSWSKGNSYSDGEGNEILSRFMRGSAGAVLSLKPSEQQEITMSATRNIARDVDFPSLPMDLISDDTWLLNVGHSLNFGSGRTNRWRTKLYASLVDHFMDNSLKNLDPRPMNTETDARTLNAGGKTEVLLWLPAGRLIAGTDMKVEEAEGSRVRTMLTGPIAGKVFVDNAWQHGRIVRNGVFAEFTANRSNQVFVVSARLDVDQSDIIDPADEFAQVYENTTSTQLNPSLSAGYTHIYDPNVSVSFWLGRSQRSASLTERYINFFPVGIDPYELLGNPELKPETNNQADFSLKYSGNELSLSMNFFASYLQEYISSTIDSSLRPRLASSPGVRRYLNLEKAMMTGFELSISYQLNSMITASMDMAYTYGLDLSAKTPLPEIPPLDMRLKLISKHFKGKLQPELSIRHVLAQQLVARNFGETSSPSFTIADLSAAYRFSKTVGFRLGITNLFNEHYYEHLNRAMRIPSGTPLYAPGRSFFATLNLYLD